MKVWWRSEQKILDGCLQNGNQGLQVVSEAGGRLVDITVSLRGGQVTYRGCQGYHGVFNGQSGDGNPAPDAADQPSADNHGLGLRYTSQWAPTAKSTSFLSRLCLVRPLQCPTPEVAALQWWVKRLLNDRSG